MPDCASTTTECGIENCAWSIAPSTLPCWPVPASVLTQAPAPLHAAVPAPVSDPPPQLAVSSTERPAAAAKTAAWRMTIESSFLPEPAVRRGPVRRDAILQDIRHVSALPALQ